MPDVLIRGMEMPTSCRDCGIEQEGFWCGALDGYQNTRCFTSERRDDCPLIEVPEHGRLIDVDAFVNRLDDGKSRNDFEIRGARRVINQLFFAPTIIPADFAEDTNVLSKEEGE